MSFDNLKHKLQSIAYTSRVYQNWLQREQPSDLRLVPQDLWPGRAALGQFYLSYDYGLGLAESLAEPPLLMELRAPAPPKGQLDLRVHDFAMLRDLRALGGDDARRRARQLISAWLDQFANWEAQSWALPSLGARISHWLALHDFYCASADDEFRARVFAALASQIRHLGLALPANLQGYQLLKALKGLLFGSVCVPGLEAYGEKALSLLLARLEGMIGADGMVRERSPLVQLYALRDLIDCRNLLRQALLPVPQQLNAVIEQMAPALRAVRHGDGGLALFHGSDEQQAVLIDAVLQQTGTRNTRSKNKTSDVGFERLTAGRVLLLVDAAPPPAAGFDKTAHAGVGAFELSVGRERLLVNCGALQRPSASWRQALAATAAHNAVVLDDRNAVEVLADGLGSAVIDFTCQRGGTAEEPSIKIDHNAYQAAVGVRCERELKIIGGGAAIEGRDYLYGVLGAAYAVRFHLHPAVQVSLIQDGRAALLKLPSGQGWRFRGAGANLVLASSVYAGDGQTPRPSKQLILEGKMNQDRVNINWYLSREN